MGRFRPAQVQLRLAQIALGLLDLACDAGLSDFDGNVLIDVVFDDIASGQHVVLEPGEAEEGEEGDEG